MVFDESFTVENIGELCSACEITIGIALGDGENALCAQTGRVGKPVRREARNRLGLEVLELPAARLTEPQPVILLLLRGNDTQLPPTAPWTKYQL